MKSNLKFCWNCRFWEKIKEEYDLENDCILEAWQGGECSAVVFVDCNGKQLKQFTRPNYSCPGWEAPEEEKVQLRVGTKEADHSKEGDNGCPCNIGAYYNKSQHGKDGDLD